MEIVIYSLFLIKEILEGGLRTKMRRTRVEGRDKLRQFDVSVVSRCSGPKGMQLSSMDFYRGIGAGNGTVEWARVID